MCRAGIGRQPAGHTGQYGNGGSHESSVGGRGGKACAAVWLSSPDPVSVAFDNCCHAACLCLDSGAEDEQADASGGHQKYRRAAAETKKEFQTVVTAVRNRGRAGRKCAESAAKSHAHRSLVAGFFLSGFFLYDVLYHDHGGQPAGDILRQIPGRLGRDGDDERYGPW